MLYVNYISISQKKCLKSIFSTQKSSFMPFCISSLLLPKEIATNLVVKTIPAYFLTLRSQKSGKSGMVLGALCLGFHKADVKMLSRLSSFLVWVKTSFKHIQVIGMIPSHVALGLTFSFLWHLTPFTFKAATESWIPLVLWISLPLLLLKAHVIH